MKRKIIKVHAAQRDDIEDLVTYRALPTSSVGPIDPFLFLNHHGPQTYSPHNGGLPFGPHPHRGFETVTFVREGDIRHHDSGGGAGVIKPGGLQWMTAGQGLVHSETSSEEFKKQGGKMEILQLWLNLPKKLKMTVPHYVDLQAQDILHLPLQGGQLHLASGEWQGLIGPVKPLIDVFMSTVDLNAGGSVELKIPADRNIFLYLVQGELEVNGQKVSERHLVEFGHEGDELEIKATKDSFFILSHAKPFGEPIVAHGPFVMNTKAEIAQAMSDYQNGILK